MDFQKKASSFFQPQTLWAIFPFDIPVCQNSSPLGMWQGFPSSLYFCSLPITLSSQKTNSRREKGLGKKRTYTAQSRDRWSDWALQQAGDGGAACLATGPKLSTVHQVVFLLALQPPSLSSLKQQTASGDQKMGRQRCRNNQAGGSAEANHLDEDKPCLYMGCSLEFGGRYGIPKGDAGVHAFETTVALDLYF